LQGWCVVVAGDSVGSCRAGAWWSPVTQSDLATLQAGLAFSRLDLAPLCSELAIDSHDGGHKGCLDCH